MPDAKEPTLTIVHRGMIGVGSFVVSIDQGNIVCVSSYVLR